MNRGDLANTLLSEDGGIVRAYELVDVIHDLSERIAALELWAKCVDATKTTQDDQSAAILIAAREVVAVFRLYRGPIGQDLYEPLYKLCEAIK